MTNNNSIRRERCSLRASITPTGSFLKSAAAHFNWCSCRQSSSLARLVALVMGLATVIAYPVTAVAATTALSAKLMDVQQRGQVIQLNSAEEISLVWEVDGDAFCSHTPTAGIENGFQFAANRWLSSATNPAPLAQGDPMTLTWSFIPDGPQGNGFNCSVPGETAGADSNLISFLDNVHGAGPGGADLTLRPWFPIFQAAFENWGNLNGINYVYEPADDGANAGFLGAPGVLGVRGDVRIGGHFLDGEVGPNVLACNFFASNGDMIIDTGNPGFYAPFHPENRRFRNVLEHEHGHGLSISHVCPINQSKLMEPFISLNFLGAQPDDILAANRGYGDRDEFPNQNDTWPTATSLGAIAIDSSVDRIQLSIDGSTDQDFYSFAAPANSRASITLTPTGSTYLDGPQNLDGSCSAGTSFNSLVENNLGVQLLGQSGSNVLATADSLPAGGPELITNLSLIEGAGTYYVRVSGAQDKAQVYNLNIELSEGGGEPQPPGETCSSFVLKTIDGKVVSICL